MYLRRMISTFSSRCFSTVPTKRLLKAIDKEIDFEHSQYKVDESVAPFLQEHGFTLEDLEGSTAVKLHKSLKDFEVEVTFVARSPLGNEGQEEEEQEGENEQEDYRTPENFSEFQVTMKKVGTSNALIYECNSTDSEIQVTNIVVTNDVYNTDKTSSFENNKDYRGPDFSTLDEKLQSSFMELLRSVGVTEDLAVFVENYSLDKEQRLYMEWLERMKSFIS